MKRIAVFFREGIYAPILMVIQSILYVYALNLTIFEVTSFWIVTVVWLAFALIVIYFVRCVFADKKFASALLTFFFAFFFQFGVLAQKITHFLNLGWIGGNIVMLMMSGVLMSTLIRTVLRFNNKNWFYMFMNIWAVVMISLALYTWWLNNNNQAFPPEFTSAVLENTVDNYSHPKNRPDVYYIIFDAYGRQDILMNIYNLDTRPFLQQLRQRGFYIGETSDSNYIQTGLSLSSSLNLDYLQDLQKQYGLPTSREEAYSLIHDNRVESFLVSQGYEVASIENDAYTVSPNIKYYFKDPEFENENTFVSLGSLVFDNSAARIFAIVPAIRDIMITPPYSKHQRQILYMFDTAAEFPSIPANIFAFIHIVSPHPPFVFDENGDLPVHYVSFNLNDANGFQQAQSREEYISGYAKQVEYINSKILKLVDSLLSAPGPKPIIILQGDHGPGAYLDFESYQNSLLQERFGIFNAYYFPDGNYSHLSPDISPVNSFRVVFNQYFGQRYPLLDNHYYYSTWSHPLDFIEATNDLKSSK